MTDFKTITEIRSVLTEEDKVKILQDFHQFPAGEHLGMNRTFEGIKLYTS